MVIALKENKWVMPGFQPEIILNNFLKTRRLTMAEINNLKKFDTL